MDLWDVAAMTALHLALFLPAWGVLTVVPVVRRWMRGRLDRE
jgi:hypothetical protein